MAAAVDLVVVIEAPAGAELAEQFGQQLVVAVASAALRAPAATVDLAVIRRWRGIGASSAGQQQEHAWSWCWLVLLPRSAGGAYAAARLCLGRWVAPMLLACWRHLPACSRRRRAGTEEDQAVRR